MSSRAELRSRIRGLVLPLLLVILICRVGYAAPLPPTIAGSYLSVPGSRVLVVAAGVLIDSLPMAQEVEQAFVQSGRADEVRTSEFLGRIETLSDAEIILRLADERLDEVAIVRATPEPAAHAWVRIYDREGQPLAEFQFGPNFAPTARVTPPARSTLAMREPAGQTAVSPSPRATSLGLDPANEEAVAAQRERVSYEKGYLTLRDVKWTYYTRRRGRLRKYTKLVMVASQGDAEEIVPWEIFYELVNRPDLLQRYQERDIFHQRLALAGGISMASSLPFLVSAAATAANEDKRVPYALVGIAGGLLFTGLIELIVAAARSPHPVNRLELQLLADLHNNQLKQQFPLPDPPMMP